MTWALDAERSRVVRRAGAVVGARVVLEDADAGEEEPNSAVLRFDRAPGQTAAAFRSMLLGAGTVQEPQGEVGAWLAHFNAQPDTEEPLA